MTSSSLLPSPRWSRAPEALAGLALVGLALGGPAARGPAGLVAVDAALGLGCLLAFATGRRTDAFGSLAVVAAAIACASALVAEDRHAAVTSLAHVARLVLAFALASSFEPSSTRRLLAVLALSGAAAAAHGAAQVLWLFPRVLAGQPDLPPLAIARLADGRATSVFILPAHLGAFLAMALAAAMALALATDASRRQRIGCGLLAAACVAGLLLASSFGAFLLAALAAAIVSWTALRARWRLIATVAAGVALAAAIAMAAARRDREIAREGPWSARALNWAVAGAMMREAPVLGSGPGSFATGHARLRTADGNDARHAHSQFLEVAAESGLAMLPLLALFVAATAARAARRVRAAASRSAAVVEAGFAAAAAAAIGHAAMDFGWAVAEWGIPAALVVGACWRGPALELAPLPAPRRRLIALAIALGVAGLLARDGLAACADRHGEAALDLAARGQHAAAAVRLGRARACEPWNDRWAADGASAALARAADPTDRSARLEEAETLARQAVRLSPNKAARHALLARVLLERGDPVGAALAALRSHQLAPHATAWAEDNARALAPFMTEAP